MTNKMNWKQNKLYAVHNGQEIMMGYIYESLHRDHEFFAVMKYRGVNESRLPFQQEFDAKQWLVNHCMTVLKKWRKH